MSVLGNPLLLGPEGYQISRSVRLRSSASAYFNRTLTTPTSATTFTFSAWIKRGKLSSGQTIVGASVAQFDGLFFNASDQLVWYVNGVATITTTAVFRDPSAWYHVVLKTSGTTSVLYVNNTQVGTGSVAAIIFNTAISHIIGQNSSSNYFDGYLTEVNFIDGQALTPSSFGETDAVTGVWKPKRYGGTYGTNGFYLNFSDPSAATAAAIGKDSSGNGNNWTPNNISVTSGVTYDSMLDVPTMWADGGNGRGNYAVLNPISKNSVLTVSDGNLKVASTNNSQYGVPATIAVSSGKWFYEAKLSASSANNMVMGFCKADINVDAGYVIAGQWLCGNYVTGTAMYVNSNGAGNVQVTSSLPAANSYLVCAMDCDNGKAWFGTCVSGAVTWYPATSGGTVGDPALGTNPTVTFTANTLITPFMGSYGAGVNWIANFGQQPFVATPPTGFKALNTQNLSDSTIAKGSLHMNALLDTGANIKTTANAAYTYEMQWIKDRANVNNHQLADTVRGLTAILQSNTTAAETTYSAPSGNSVGWVWNANAAGVSNTSGSITSQVSANPMAGFSVVTYTGTGANATVGHGLGVAPKMVIAKHRNAVDNWIVYHASLGGSPDYLWLNLTSAKGTSSAVWNTAPTSTVFGIGTDNLTNLSSGTYVAYAWSEVAGYSKFGSYTGNGSADGPFVYCGFRPKFVMYKRTDTTGNWIIYDSGRSTYNQPAAALYPNLSNAEDVSHPSDFLSNGFKLRSTGADSNASGGTYIFAAFAENPFKNSLAR